MKDTKESLGDKKVIKRISITSDGLKALALVLPEILRIIDKGFTKSSKRERESKREEEEEEYSEETDDYLVQPLKKRK